MQKSQLGISVKTLVTETAQTIPVSEANIRFRKAVFMKVSEVSDKNPWSKPGWGGWEQQKKESVIYFKG